MSIRWRCVKLATVLSSSNHDISYYYMTCIHADIVLINNKVDLKHACI